MIYTLNKEYQQ